MALIEDLVKGNVVTVVAIGATAIILPAVLPSLPAPVRGMVRSGVSLFLESEAEAEGGIVRRLAEVTLKSALDSLSGPGSPEERRARARAAVERFARTARTRARRYARSDGDRKARAERHFAALHHAIGRARARHGATRAAHLDDVSALLAEV